MRRSNLSDDLITITQKLMMARERSEVINVASDCTALIERLIALETQGSIAALQQHARSVTTIIKFTYKEIQMMSFTFKKEFIANGLAAHVIKKESGRNSYCYEIRYRSNGYNIIASSTDLAEAKRKFLAKTSPCEIEKYRVQKRATGLNLLEEVFEEWYQYKTGTVTEKTLKWFRTNFLSLPEKIRKSPISIIRTGDIDKVLKSESPRQYEELRTLFNGIFKYATASGIIVHNPVSLIKFKRAERKNRECLSEKEIYMFLERLTLPEFEPIRQGAYLLYFFGLRPCEIDEETHREGDFLITRNRKRKNGKIEYKKIPIPKQAQGLIDWDKPLTFQRANNHRSLLFKKLLGEQKTAYCLRHTFSTLCQQFLKRPDIVDIWMGDSSERLVGRVYTHFSDEFMRQQMDTVIFPTLNSRG